MDPQGPVDCGGRDSVLFFGENKALEGYVVVEVVLVV